MTLLAASLRNVWKTYPMDGVQVHALRGISLDIRHGEYVAIMGASGSGKSTLLNLLGCLDRPTSGTILLDGVDISRLNDNQLSELRARRIGFIFQSYNLIPQLTVLENIEVPLYYSGCWNAKSRARCRELAAKVGLADRLHHRPTQLSGGQQQRVAIARSLVNNPSFILADEPTGNLDSATAEEILLLIDQLHQEGKTIILVTHEPDVARRARRLIRLRDGRIQSDQPNPTFTASTSHQISFQSGCPLPSASTGSIWGPSERSQP
ncbi:MAG: ABC transporter ATP-binding protein [Thermoguttaceae bacterium]|nr:ABC transporter ATP-binding protein [Thermoguttaceae bacterium]MDW8038508.1 ABC transporter ATP-binding protein [Thermoguttaceae bacterium]